MDVFDPAGTAVEFAIGDGRLDFSTPVLEELSRGLVHPARQRDTTPNMATRVDRAQIFIPLSYLNEAEGNVGWQTESGTGRMQLQLRDKCLYPVVRLSNDGAGLLEE